MFVLGFLPFMNHFCKVLLQKRVIKNVKCSATIMVQTCNSSKASLACLKRLVSPMAHLGTKQWMMTSCATVRRASLKVSWCPSGTTPSSFQDIGRPKPITSSLYQQLLSNNVNHAHLQPRSQTGRASDPNEIKEVQRRRQEVSQAKSNPRSDWQPLLLVQPTLNRKGRAWSVLLHPRLIYCSSSDYKLESFIVCIAICY